jgi:hypothetical protein
MHLFWFDQALQTGLLPLSIENYVKQDLTIVQERRIFLALGFNDPNRVGFFSSNIKASPKQAK